ncbi:MAG: hypothetical protein AMXMBFR53_38060 [Gemmatimonadota bacterium]
MRAVHEFLTIRGPNLRRILANLYPDEDKRDDDRHSTDDFCKVGPFGEGELAHGDLEYWGPPNDSGVLLRALGAGNAGNYPATIPPGSLAQPGFRSPGS